MSEIKNAKEEKNPSICSPLYFSRMHFLHLHTVTVVLKETTTKTQTNHSADHLVA